MTDDEWKEAEEYLRTMEQGYTSIGSAGYFGLTFAIQPLRHRFEKGERSQELYDSIMELK